MERDFDGESWCVLEMWQSFGATCTMRFQDESGEERRTAAVELPSRSMYLLTGDARDLWQHRIAPTDELRYSITMRTLRKSYNEND